MRIEVDTDKQLIIVKSKVNLGELNTWVAHNLGDPSKWSIALEDKELDYSDVYTTHRDAGLGPVNYPGVGIYGGSTSTNISVADCDNTLTTGTTYYSN